MFQVTESGANFAFMLQELVTLNNHCEVTWDYILGAPLEDLPIVEQIPILHRLGTRLCFSLLFSRIE